MRKMTNAALMEMPLIRIKDIQQAFGVSYDAAARFIRSRHALRHSDCQNVLSFSVLPTLAGVLRAFRARRISQHPAGKSCRVFALTPAAFAPQSFLSPRCSVAVLYGDPVYGFRSRHAHYPTKFPHSALLRCGTLRGPRLNVFNRWALGYSSCSVTRGTASTV